MNAQADAVFASLHAKERAGALRREAHEACAARVWKTCLDKLDLARALDPTGDAEPDVQALRRSAAGGAGGP